MKFLIRFIRRTASGSVERQDKAFSGDAITMGRATDQTVHLRDRRVALQHARIAQKGNRFYITTQSLLGITVNDKSCRDARVKIGDTIRVGSNILKIIDPPEGFDFAFTFELDPDVLVEEALFGRYQTTLAQTRLAKRPWSWLLVTAVLFIFLVVPLAMTGSDNMRSGSEAFLLPGWVQSMIPDDRVWDSGPLHPAHRSQIGTDCRQCHAVPFVMVRDEECVACHDASHHVDADRHRVAELEASRCGLCHMEHNGVDGLVRRDPSVCSDCHGSLASSSETVTDLLDVSDFGSAHPAFKVSVLSPIRQGELVDWISQRVKLSAPELAEISNLKFPHDVHLDPDGIKAPDGTVVMQCDDCHSPQPGGALMAPVTMELSCERCHRLSFDATDPQRVVPHGSPEQVVQMLEEYYSYRYLTGGGETTPAASGSRRPGRPATREQRAQAMRRAGDQAQAIAAELFERRACANCHEISVAESGDVGSRWQVEPVMLTANWLPKARFDHSRHRTREMQCGLCHAAADSNDSKDVLIPDVAICRECHGGSDASRGRLTSTCVDCHRFHNPRHGSMRVFAASEPDNSATDRSGDKR